MSKPTVGTWRTEEAKARFHAMEDEIWSERFGDRPTALDVDTFAGPTRVYRWPGEGEPIVFLHGSGGTGLTWAAYVEALPGRDRWAIDTIGDMGRSEQRVPITDVAMLARWLDETLAGAGIARAHLVGTSYGAFTSLALAVHRPERVASLTLIDGGGLSKFRLARFMLWGLPMLFGSKAPASIRLRMAKTRPMLEDPRVMQMALFGQTNHRMALPAPDVFTDDELRSITVPVVAVVAGKSAPFPPKIAAARARLIPNAKVDVVDGAGHEVMWTHVERCVSHVTDATL